MKKETIRFNIVCTEFHTRNYLPKVEVNSAWLPYEFFTGEVYAVRLEPSGRLFHDGEYDVRHMEIVKNEFWAQFMPIFGTKSETTIEAWYGPPKEEETPSIQFLDKLRRLK